MSIPKQENQINQQPQKRSAFLSFLDNYNPKIIKKRLAIIQGSPYKALKFQFYATRAIIVGLILFICYQLITIIIKYDGRSSTMTMIGRAVMLFIMVMITIKAWGLLTPLKNALKQYEKNPVAQQEFRKIDINKEVNEILDKYDENNKLKEIKKNGIINK